MVGRGGFDGRWECRVLLLLVVVGLGRINEWGREALSGHGRSWHGENGECLTYSTAQKGLFSIIKCSLQAKISCSGVSLAFRAFGAAVCKVDAKEVYRRNRLKGSVRAQV